MCRTDIQGVTYRLAQGVVKHIIPAVASTNAVIAAAVALEAFIIASSCATTLDNYLVFNDTDGKDGRGGRTKRMVTAFKAEYVNEKPSTENIYLICFRL